MNFTYDIGIETNDMQTIYQLFLINPNGTYGELCSKIKFHFKQDIKPGHYAYLGYLIGENVAAENAAISKHIFNLN
jgi:hypothetical protein